MVKIVKWTLILTAIAFASYALYKYIKGRAQVVPASEP